MSNHYRIEENKKELLIQQLLLLGVFKKGELHLFELTLLELEDYVTKLTNT
ncbi:MAG TPA: Fur-regulated basic protein FbpA [Pseudoneobacillus sp.]|nr:Fur-regulated basic protein FbpA [Pseudoneobacillus sp.]